MDLSEIKPGLYLAKSRAERDWWDLVVEVIGTMPFLRTRVWNRAINQLCDLPWPETIIWGLRIAEK